MITRLFIVGMPASGKSLIGNEISDRLELPFYDLDDGIEFELGLPIPEVFEKHGEHFFRMRESKLLRHFPNMTDQYVLATGGGAPCYYDNMGFMNNEGVTLFLDVPVPELVRRLNENEVEKRPLFWGRQGKDLDTYLDELYMHRKPFYDRAKLTLTGEDITVDEVMHCLSKPGLFT